MAPPLLPETIRNEEELDELLTRPDAALIESMRSVAGPLLVIGASGKMGPTLCVLARRAAEASGTRLEIIAASRFGDPRARPWLEERGVRTVACDALDRASVAQLPDAPSVIYLVGMKFGTSENPAATWAANTIAPHHTAERFSGSRIVALSTGNVYPLVAANSCGAKETDPTGPVGEYGWAALARERIFLHHSRLSGTAVATIRLNYAVELRYGVLVDIASKVLRGEEIDLAMGHLNCIWQRDANSSVLRSLALAESPPRVLNVTGPEPLSVRKLAMQLGRFLDRGPRFRGEEAPTALLADTSTMLRLLGAPAMPIDRILACTAAWIRAGGRLLGKPTHFEARDGKF